MVGRKFANFVPQSQSVVPDVCRNCRFNEVDQFIDAVRAFGVWQVRPDEERCIVRLHGLRFIVTGGRAGLVPAAIASLVTGNQTANAQGGEQKSCQTEAEPATLFMIGFGHYAILRNAPAAENSKPTYNLRRYSSGPMYPSFSSRKKISWAASSAVSASVSIVTSASVGTS